MDISNAATVVAVGSKNKVKIKPVKEVFEIHFKDVEVVGVAVESGVPEQPVGDDIIFKGAYNRAKAAILEIPEAHYGVGIEGGIHKYDYGWLEYTLVVIVNRKGEIGIGSSGGLQLPIKILTEIESGKNLEEAADMIFGTKQVGESIGLFGLLTKKSLLVPPVSKTG